MGAKALFDTFSENLAEAKLKTLGDTLGDGESDALEDTLAATLTESQAEDFSYQLSDMDFKALVDRPADIWEGLEAKTLGDTLDDVDGKTPFDTLVYTIAEADSGTL